MNSPAVLICRYPLDVPAPHGQFTGCALPLDTWPVTHPCLAGVGMFCCTQLDGAQDSNVIIVCINPVSLCGYG